MKRKITLAWSYAVEVILSLLTLAFGAIAIGWESIQKLTIQLSSNFTTLFLIVMLAAAITATCTLYGKSETKFLVWMERRRILRPYIHAMGYATLVFATSTIASVLISKFNHAALVTATAFLFILSIINTYTMLSNFHGLFKLNMTFNSIDESL